MEDKKETTWFWNDNGGSVSHSFGFPGVFITEMIIPNKCKPKQIVFSGEAFFHKFKGIQNEDRKWRKFEQEDLKLENNNIISILGFCVDFNMVFESDDKIPFELQFRYFSFNLPPKLPVLLSLETKMRSLQLRTDAMMLDLLCGIVMSNQRCYHGAVEMMEKVYADPLSDVPLFRSMLNLLICYTLHLPARPNVKYYCRAVGAQFKGESLDRFLHMNCDKIALISLELLDFPYMFASIAFYMFELLYDVNQNYRLQLPLDVFRSLIDKIFNSSNADIVTARTRFFGSVGYFPGILQVLSPKVEEFIQNSACGKDYLALIGFFTRCCIKESYTGSMIQSIYYIQEFHPLWLSFTSCHSLGRLNISELGVILNYLVELIKNVPSDNLLEICDAFGRILDEFKSPFVLPLVLLQDFLNFFSSKLNAVICLIGENNVSLSEVNNEDFMTDDDIATALGWDSNDGVSVDQVEPPILFNPGESVPLNSEINIASDILYLCTTPMFSSYFELYAKGYFLVSPKECCYTLFQSFKSPHVLSFSLCEAVFNLEEFNIGRIQGVIYVWKHLVFELAMNRFSFWINRLASWLPYNIQDSVLDLVLLFLPYCKNSNFITVLLDGLLHPFTVRSSKWKVVLTEVNDIISSEDFAFIVCSCKSSSFSSEYIIFLANLLDSCKVPYFTSNFEIFQELISTLFLNELTRKDALKLDEALVHFLEKNRLEEFNYSKLLCRFNSQTILACELKMDYLILTCRSFELVFCNCSTVEFSQMSETYKFLLQNLTYSIPETLYCTIEKCLIKFACHLSYTLKVELFKLMCDVVESSAGVIADIYLQTILCCFIRNSSISTEGVCGFYGQLENLDHVFARKLADYLDALNILSLRRRTIILVTSVVTILSKYVCLNHTKFNLFSFDWGESVHEDILDSLKFRPLELESLQEIKSSPVTPKTNAGLGASEDKLELTLDESPWFASVTVKSPLYSKDIDDDYGIIELDDVDDDFDFENNYSGKNNFPADKSLSHKSLSESKTEKTDVESVPVKVEKNFRPKSAKGRDRDSLSLNANKSKDGFRDMSLVPKFNKRNSEGIKILPNCNEIEILKKNETEDSIDDIGVDSDCGDFSKKVIGSYKFEDDDRYLLKDCYFEDDAEIPDCSAKVFNKLDISPFFSPIQSLMKFKLPPNTFSSVKMVANLVDESNENLNALPSEFVSSYNW